MTYTIHLTKDWPYERIAQYGPQITQAMKKIAARFPDDVTLERMARRIAQGEEDLWLILDENEEFAAFVTTEIEITERGRKRLMLLELAGDGGEPLAEMIKPIEEWAAENGIDEICPIGRWGWIRIMKKLGYTPDVVKFKKEL